MGNLSSRPPKYYYRGANIAENDQFICKNFVSGLMLGQSILLETFMKKIFLSILVAFAFTAGAVAADSTYYVVRHAEKQATDLSGGDNPVLTQKGVKRAAHIVDILKDVPFDAVYSTETYRTVMTATPTAADRGLDVKLFTTDDLGGFAEQLKAMRGTYLIVAHSSSTPDLASLLSGETVPKLDESDYEQMFKIEITGGTATLTQFQTTFD